MKMTKEHYDKLASALQAYLSKTGIDALALYYASLRKNKRIKNPDMAFRWGILHKSDFRIGDGRGLIGDINGDYNDNHIDTALRKFFKHKE